jgi:ABC-type branched-subunit amino acid transport system substrate-binding protein
MAAAYRINQTYNFNVTVVASDTATDPATAKTAAQSLVSSGVEVIVGAAASGATLAAAEVTIPNNVPLISYASTSPSITALGDNDYVFRVVASDTYQGQALAQLAHNKGVTKAYILNLDNAYGNGVAEQFKNKFESLGGTVAGQTPYDPAATSFSSEVSTVKSSTADGIIIIAYPDDGNKIFAEANTQNVDLPWFGTDGIASSSVTNNTATRDYLTGRLFGTTPSTGGNATDTVYTQFVNDLTTTGGTYGVYGDYAYDAFLVAAAGIAKANAYDGQKIRDGIYAGADGLVGATSPDKSFNCDGEPLAQAYDYWNATGYSVTTEVAAAAVFSGLGTKAIAPCGDHPYVSSTASSSAVSSSASTTSSAPPTPGFEALAVLSLLGAVSINYLRKRKQK